MRICCILCKDGDRLKSKICTKYLALTLRPKPSMSVSFKASTTPLPSSSVVRLFYISSMVLLPMIAEPPCGLSFRTVTCRSDPLKSRIAMAESTG